MALDFIPSYIRVRTRQKQALAVFGKAAEQTRPDNALGHENKTGRGLNLIQPGTKTSVKLLRASLLSGIEKSPHGDNTSGSLPAHQLLKNLAVELLTADTLLALPTANRGTDPAMSPIPKHPDYFESRFF